MTNTKRIEILKRLVNEEEDQIRLVESGLSDEGLNAVLASERCRNNIVVYTRMITRLLQKS
ncbi:MULTISPECIES: hypothetical protein [Aurantimonas]|uniref:hypothetical protein n=1 Tax=Aurantimonas TaxID=182269 RepID=UPI003510D4BD